MSELPLFAQPSPTPEPLPPLHDPYGPVPIVANTPENAARIQAAAQAKPSRRRTGIYRVTRLDKNGEVFTSACTAASRIEALDEMEKSDREAGETFTQYGIETIRSAE